ncbi:hypothetical protein BX666DRAFT_1201593 [Dichotomocladium elegans]|nr:hypothetical protein BX666DRAFT_1201593 [Dichotomocladium elegans]
MHNRYLPLRYTFFWVVVISVTCWWRNAAAEVLFDAHLVQTALTEGRGNNKIWWQGTVSSRKARTASDFANILLGADLFFFYYLCMSAACVQCRERARARVAGFIFFSGPEGENLFSEQSDHEAGRIGN